VLGYWKPRLGVGFHLRFNPLVRTLGPDFPARPGGKKEGMNWITKFILVACTALAIAGNKALAHISYTAGTARDFGTVDSPSSDPSTYLASAPRQSQAKLLQAFLAGPMPPIPTGAIATECVDFVSPFSEIQLSAFQ